jgi:hypothetical protein
MVDTSKELRFHPKRCVAIERTSIKEVGYKENCY